MDCGFGRPGLDPFAVLVPTHHVDPLILPGQAQSRSTSRWALSWVCYWGVVCAGGFCGQRPRERQPRGSPSGPPSRTATVLKYFEFGWTDEEGSDVRTPGRDSPPPDSRRSASRAFPRLACPPGRATAPVPPPFVGFRSSASTGALKNEGRCAFQEVCGLVHATVSSSIAAAE